MTAMIETGHPWLGGGARAVDTAGAHARAHSSHTGHGAQGEAGSSSFVDSTENDFDYAADLSGAGEFGQPFDDFDDDSCDGDSFYGNIMATASTTWPDTRGCSGGLIGCSSIVGAA